MMSPTDSAGTAISTSITGSSRVGRACSMAALKPKEPASLKAISFESTGWYLPSMQRTRTSTTGKPASGPWTQASRTPFSTAGIRLRGIEPPTISSDELEARPAGQRLDASGSRPPNMPLPPVCFFSLPSTFSRPA